MKGETKQPIKFYRYTWYEQGQLDSEGEPVMSFFPSVVVRKHEYRLKKETSKGYWIKSEFDYIEFKKWVSKTAKSRFAYPTEQEAMNNFIARTKVRIEILKRMIEGCNEAIIIAERMSKETEQP